MIASRERLIERLPKHGAVAEIGVDRGEFSRHILAAAAPARFHLIDLDFAALDPALRQDARVALHLGRSHDEIARFPDDHFDWIYIDADHSYAGVARDITAAAPKVKPGGYLVFNDFAHADPNLGAYGVHRAVAEFVLARRWPFAFFAYSRAALYDVAVQRPL